MRSLLDLWMLRLEETCGMPREDLLFLFRERLLGQRTVYLGDELCRMPAHPDELTPEELFTFMWQVRRMAKRLLNAGLEFNTEWIISGH